VPFGVLEKINGFGLKTEQTKFHPVSSEETQIVLKAPRLRLPFMGTERRLGASIYN
jgi:hypothetical protein